MKNSDLKRFFETDASNNNEGFARLNENSMIPATALRTVVTDMTALTSAQCEALECGDVVIKEDSTGRHAYMVSFKKAGVGMCITYTDCENVETVAYNCVEGVWTYDSTDVTHIAQ